MKSMNKILASIITLCVFSSTVPHVLAAEDTLYPGATNLIDYDSVNKDHYYSEQIANEMVPAAVNQILNTYPALKREYFRKHRDPIRIAVKTYTPQSPNAFVTSLNSGEILLAYSVGKHMKALPFPLGNGVQKDIRKIGGAQSSIIHECTHLVYGLSIQGISSPGWFNEGIAEATASGIAWNSSATPNNGLEILKRDALNSGSARANYGQGYYAVMYIGWMAGGRKTIDHVSHEEFEQSIKDGLNRLFERMISKKKNGVNGGVIFQEAVQETTNKSVSDIIKCFGPNLTGKEEHLQEMLLFMKDFATVTGSMKQFSGGLASSNGLKTPIANILDYSPNGKKINYSALYPYGFSNHDSGGGPVKTNLFDKTQNTLPKGYIAPPQTPVVNVINYQKTKTYDGKSIIEPSKEQLSIKNATSQLKIEYEWYQSNDKGEWLNKLSTPPSEVGIYHLIVKAGNPNADNHYPSVIWGLDTVEGITITK